MVDYPIVFKLPKQILLSFIEFSCDWGNTDVAIVHGSYILRALLNSQELFGKLGLPWILGVLKLYFVLILATSECKRNEFFTVRLDNFILSLDCPWNKLLGLWFGNFPWGWHFHIALICYDRCRVVIGWNPHIHLAWIASEKSINNMHLWSHIRCLFFKLSIINIEKLAFSQWQHVTFITWCDCHQ